MKGGDSPLVKEVKRVPKIKWEKLQLEEVAQEYRSHMEEKMEAYVEGRRQREGELGEMTGWESFAEVVVEGAKEVCGVREKGVENPWMVGKEEEIGRLNRNVSVCVERKIREVEKQRVGEEHHREEAQEGLREARNERRRCFRRWEREYWRGVVDECRDADC